MYLKAIEIIGFKSFADKARLNFEPGVSCIVGPNGCGKSNVIDSVRWAVGEMSWKSLRSGSMVDIIFNGTKKRPPLNMAQVNMIFDNSSRKLPVDFGEVTVSRKIYRSGESEYYLNRVQCRLRDIRELFLDTGIGGEGYAIIDQGSVEQILRATPEQRREMFEEVAGVSKYKAKRDEAQHKLEKVDLDIARLSDTLALIAEQVKKLDSEARKARLYQKYREELKESEIALSLDGIKTHDAQINRLMAELEPLTKAAQDASATISAREGECAALDLNLTHKQKEFNAFGEKIAAGKYQIGLLEGAIKNCENLSNELTLQVKGSHYEEELGKARSKELLPAIENLQNKLNNLGAELEPLQNKYNEKYNLVQTNELNLKQAEQDYDKANTALMQAGSSQMEFSGKIALEESAVSHENNNLINLERTLQTHAAQAQNLAKEIETLQTDLAAKKAKVETLKTDLTQAETLRVTLQNMRQSLNDKLTQLKTKKAAVNTKMQMIQTQGKNDPYWVGAKLVDESNINGIKGTLRKNIKFPKEYTLAVEEAFGKYLDSALCGSFEQAASAIELLNKNGKARCRFIVLSAVPKTNANSSLYKDGTDIKSVLKYPAELEDLINFIVQDYKASDAQVGSSFWISGGAKDVKSPEAYWGEEETAKAEFKELNEQEEDLSANVIRNFDEIKNTEEKIKTLRTDFQSESLSLNSLQNDFNSKQRSLNDTAQISEQIKRNKDDILSRIGARKEKIGALKTKLAELNAQHEKAKADLETLRKKREDIQNEAHALKLEIEACNSQLYEVKIRKNNLEQDLKAAKAESLNLQEAETKRQEQILKSNDRIAALNAEKLSAQAKLAAERDALAELEISESKMRQDLLAIKNDFDTKNAALSAAKTRINELTIKIHDLENNLTNHRRQKTGIINNLFESWNITPEEAQMKWGDKQVDYERVKMMRKRIESMGAVNMTAPEEYDALTERDTFLKKQIEDLTSAKRDLKAAIAKINATTKDNFKYTFEQVRMHFKSIYQTLFHGGEAELALTKPEDLLETGIEIIVQPPGKKLLNISALSGGEKALTAVSLLFAFFTHNPSPFCILDEADAPLDEANVERFVNLIKEFSKRTQFIVVTHNKRTMEAAQMLYGITMEENGVSKVLSLDLRAQDSKTKELVAAAS